MRGPLFLWSNLCPLLSHHRPLSAMIDCTAVATSPEQRASKMPKLISLIQSSGIPHRTSCRMLQNHPRLRRRDSRNLRPTFMPFFADYGQLIRLRAAFPIGERRWFLITEAVDAASNWLASSPSLSSFFNRCSAPTRIASPPPAPFHNACQPSLGRRWDISIAPMRNYAAEP